MNIRKDEITFKEPTIFLMYLLIEIPHFKKVKADDPVNYVDNLLNCYKSAKRLVDIIITHELDFDKFNPVHRFLNLISLLPDLNKSNNIDEIECLYCIIHNIAHEYLVAYKGKSVI